MQPDQINSTPTVMSKAPRFIHRDAINSVCIVTYAASCVAVVTKPPEIQVENRFERYNDDT